MFLLLLLRPTAGGPVVVPPVFGEPQRVQQLVDAQLRIGGGIEGAPAARIGGRIGARVPRIGEPTQ